MTGQATSMRVERPKKSLRELAQDSMRQAILNFRFVPGQRLTERILCEELGVSRTVVREVLRYLEAEGLVEVTLHKGPIVAPIRPQDVEQIYELRSLLESVAARDCARSADPEALAKLERCVDDLRTALSGAPLDSLRATTAFYREMFAAAGKHIAWEMFEALNVRINALRAITISQPGRRAKAAEEVQKLFEAISARDADLSARLSADHVEHAMDVARDFLKELEADEDVLTRRLATFAGGGTAPA